MAIGYTKQTVIHLYPEEDEQLEQLLGTLRQRARATGRKPPTKSSVIRQLIRDAHKSVCGGDSDE